MLIYTKVSDLIIVRPKNLSLLSICLILSLVSVAQSAHKIATTDATKDFSEMFETIKSVHFNAFHKLNEEELTRKKDSIIASWNSDSITFRTFTRSGMQLTAFMSNGHTSFDWQNPKIFPELLSSVYLPVKIKRSKGEYIITQSGTKDLVVGDKIKSINDRNIKTLYDELLALTGGVTEFRKAVTEKMFPFYLFFILQENDHYEIKLSTGDTRMIPGVSIQEALNIIQSEVSKEPYTFEIINNNIGLLSYNSCEDYDGFKSFLETTFLQIKQQRIKKLIIDIRSNSGGNSNLNDLLLSYLTRKKYRQSSGRYWKVSKEIQEKIKRDSLWHDFKDTTFLSTYLSKTNGEMIDEIDYSKTRNSKPKNYYRGKHCFLIGPYTFSSANYLADAVRTFSLSTLIGSSTGELTNDFGEQVEFQLSYSSSYYFVPVTFDIGANTNKESMTTVSPHLYSESADLQRAIDFLHK